MWEGLADFVAGLIDLGLDLWLDRIELKMEKKFNKKMEQKFNKKGKKTKISLEKQ